MTATEHVDGAGRSTDGDAVRRLRSSALRARLQRGALALGGGGLLLATLALWLAPGASWESDLLLFKAALSLTLCLAAAGLLAGCGQNAPVRMEIDTGRRELRQVRLRGNGMAEILWRCRYADLAPVEPTGNALLLRDRAGTVRAEVVFDDPGILSDLLSDLREARQRG
ncbi:hypothetical protein ACFSUD_09965 [Sulfitobacter aestuarii]|uniref:PH domain-containing protein n=1 Tax=Sulfitobacter aestuarii TaxID=2161676 RepID=A0ABW5U239_9RHOB